MCIRDSNYKPSFDFKRGTPFKSNNITKNIPSTSDFERRKLAEQRATKRLKADVENKDKKTKIGSKKALTKLLIILV